LVRDNPAAGCNEQTLMNHMERATLEETFADEGDVEALDWETQQITFTRAATVRLVSNWDEFTEDDEGVALRGLYPESEDRFFVVALGDRRISGGFIGGMGGGMMTTLFQPPACPLIYPGQPLVHEGRLVLGIGFPKIEEFGEDFFKVFIEEGAEKCFRPVLNDEVRLHFKHLGKLAAQRWGPRRHAMEGDHLPPARASAGVRSSVPPVLISDSSVPPIGPLPVEPSAYLAPALAVTVYFRPVVEEYWEGVVACLEEFLADWEGDLSWYADADSGKFRPASAELLRRPLERLRSTKPMRFYAWTMYSGETYDGAGALNCQGHLHDPLAWDASMRDAQARDLCYLRASFPVAAYDSAARLAAFVDLAARWSERLPFVHGYAGLALNQPDAPGKRQSQSSEVWALARRYPGFEVEDCGGTVLVAQSAIKSINWLTLLGTVFVDRLGGVAALRTKLPEAIVFHELPDGRGLLIQAGPAPAAGDAERGDRLLLYGEVARALRSIRLVEHPAFGPEECGSFGPRGTAEWLRRFD
jgi:Protein of unknown function (DUF3396)